ncbi:MAG: hypothetical protein WCI66_00905 [Gammaproteobacteria bacterium]|jgi:hypothetical protein
MFNRKQLTLLAVALIAASAANAQRAPKKEAPHTPAPKMADGRVDFSGNGIWDLPYITDISARIVGAQKGDQPPMLPWAMAHWKYNRSNDVKFDPEGLCLPPGGPRAMGTPYPAEIVQDDHNKRILIIFEGGGHVWREIHMDGRAHPVGDKLNPTYFGDAIGKWEGDTLVVDTVGFNEKSWIDYNGHTHTDQLHTIERFSRPYKEVMHYEATFDDPGAYSKPWTVAWDIDWNEGAELQEYICQENNKYLGDLKDDTGKPFFKTTEGK